MSKQVRKYRKEPQEGKAGPKKNQLPTGKRKTADSDAKSGKSPNHRRFPRLYSRFPQKARGRPSNPEHSPTTNCRNSRTGSWKSANSTRAVGTFRRPHRTSQQSPTTSHRKFPPHSPCGRDVQRPWNRPPKKNSEGPVRRQDPRVSFRGKSPSS